MMQRLIFFAILSCIPAFAANCTDAGTCPTECPGTAGSLTFGAIPNTAFTSPAGTSIASTDCLYSIRYDSTTSACPTDHAVHANPGQCIMAVFMPNGVAASSLFWIVCYHQGGGSAGNAEGCFGPAGTSIPIQLIQLNLDSPNPVGGRGIGIIEVEYRLSTSPGVATFPAQFQDVACSVSFVQAGALLGFVPPMLGYIGFSWGAELSFWAGNIPTSVYGASGTCLSPDLRPASSRTASVDPLMSWAKPNGSAGYDFNSSGAATTAIKNALNCSSQATCQTADAALNGTPYLNITSGNLNQMSNTQMFEWVNGDQITTPYWSSNTAGNAVYTISAYQTLGIAPAVKIYTPTNPPCVVSAGGHLWCWGQVLSGQTIGDAMTFLLGGLGPISSSAGNSVF